MPTKLFITISKTTLCIFAFSSLLFVSPVLAQSKNIGINCGSTITANRFGTIFSPSLFYRSGKSHFSIGATIQKDKPVPSGFQLGYEYTLMDPQIDNTCNLNWIELYAFTDVGYYNKAFLGKGACEEEHLTNPELKTDVSKLELKEIHGYIGFGIRTILFRNLKWFNGIAIGGYEVLKTPEDLFYNGKGIGLLLRTGISLEFGKRQKVTF